jgi:hypothetical protein
LPNSVVEYHCNIFPLVCPLPCFAPISSQVRAHPTKRHVTCQVACAKGLVACYIPLSTPNMSKTCLEMPRWGKKKLGKGQTGEKIIE